MFLQTLCNGHFKLLFSLMQYEEEKALPMLALEVVAIVTANRDCVADIANAQCLVYLFFAMQATPHGSLNRNGGGGVTATT